MREDDLLSWASAQPNIYKLFVADWLQQGQNAIVRAGKKTEEKKPPQRGTSEINHSLFIKPDYFSEIYFPPLFMALFSFMLILRLLKVEFLDLQHL